MHPRRDPDTVGFLDRPGGVRVCFETSGDSRNRPALYLHGGPGGSLGRGGYRTWFDPDSWYLVGLDQRGSGRSTPWACDALDDLDGTTTAAMIDDIEALREHLGIRRWVVAGASWGSTLALAYALAHPQRCTALLLYAVTAGSRAEIDWLTRDVGRIFPEAWQRFVDHVGGPGAGRTVEAYARLLRDRDPGVRRAAADEWDRWEAAHVSLAAGGPTGAFLHEDPRVRLNFATLVTHFWSQDCFLTGDRRVLPRVAELAGTPGVLLHGRQDVSGPAGTAWQLHRGWPGSELHVEETEGHGGPLLSARVVATTDRWAAEL